jgi:hypothetical protein
MFSKILTQFGWFAILGIRFNLVCWMLDTRPRRQNCSLILKVNITLEKMLLVFCWTCMYTVILKMTSLVAEVIRQVNNKC